MKSVIIAIKAESLGCKGQKGPVLVKVHACYSCLPGTTVTVNKNTVPILFALLQLLAGVAHKGADRSVGIGIGAASRTRSPVVRDILLACFDQALDLRVLREIKILKNNVVIT